MSYAEDHQWSQRHLSHYVEGDLSSRARRRLDRHARDCADCGRGLRAMRALVHAVHGLDALAGRGGSRHRHPLPEMQDNKAEHTAETRAACQLPENEHDRKSERQPRPPTPHYAEPGAARTLSGARSSR